MATTLQLKRIGEYTVVATLGSGTYGTVYKAVHRSSRKDAPRAPIAIKCVARKSLTRKAEDNLVEEIRLLKSFHNPHIVRLHDHMCDPAHVYMLMEYCSAGDLSQFIQKQRGLPEKVTQHFMRQLGIALQYIHERGCAHLDLKPQNLLLQPSPSGQLILKVADFGFARRLTDDDLSSSLRGSPLYMAPEMLRRGVYDGRADLWSVGVIFFEALYGYAPFASRTYDALMQRILSDDGIEIPALPPVSDECRDLLKRLLVRDPDLRMGFEEFFAHPFVDIAHYPSEKCLPRAKALAHKAVEAERKGKARLAYGLYQDGLAYYIPALNFERDSKRKAELRKEIERLLAHAEKLRDVLDVNIGDRSFNNSAEMCFARADLLVPTPGVDKKFTQGMAKAFDSLRLGYNFDKREQYRVALHHYQKGLDTLMKQAAQHGPSIPPDLLKKLHFATGGYMGRAERLQKHEELATGIGTDDLDGGRCGIQ